MPLKESIQDKLNQTMPHFDLYDVVSKEVKSTQQIIKKVNVIMFICNHCPYVIHLNEAISNMAREFEKEPVQFIAVSSNDADSYPDDSPENLALQAQNEGFIFPYLYDEEQKIATLYDAQCTPEFYVLNSEMKLVYHGRFDGSRPNSEIQVTGDDLRFAISALLKGEPQKELQYPSMGCSIKWKKS